MTMFSKCAVRHSVIAVALVATAITGGCKKKKQPQVAQAPTLSEPQPAPPQSQQAPGTSQASSQRLPSPPQQSSPSSSQNTQAQAKPKHKPRPANSHKSAPPKNGAPENTPASRTVTNNTTTVAENVPPKITIKPAISDVGGAISATAPHSDDVHDKLTTEQLLQSTDDNLKSIKRALTPDELSQVAQIRSFMTQSRSATAESDVVRARNLALKAHLLSDELLRHR